MIDTGADTPVSTTGRPGIVAVSIGIDRYDSPDFPDLNCAVNDAAQLADLLDCAWHDSPDRIIHLCTWPLPDRRMTYAPPASEEIGMPDRLRVTKDALLQTLRRAARAAVPGDTLLIYFAGHGTFHVGEPCLVILTDQDTIGHAPSHPEPDPVGDRADDRDESRLESRLEYLGLAELLAAAGVADGVKRLLILDCCQESEETSRDTYAFLERINRDWTIWLTCSPGKWAIEDGAEDLLQSGLFMASLVEGITGGAADPDGSVSLLSLAAYTAERLMIEATMRRGHLLSVNSRRKKLTTAGDGYQDPVIIGHALGGTQQDLLIAPRAPFRRRVLRHPAPTPHFWRYWLRYLLRNWPIVIPDRALLQFGSGLAYASVLLFILLGTSAHSPTAAEWQVACIGGLGGFALWEAMLAWSVAANEDYWHAGGWVPTALFLFWNLLVCLTSWLLHPVTRSFTDAFSQAALLTLVVFWFGTNAFHTALIFGELLRGDQRGDTGHLVRIFRQVFVQEQQIDLDIDNIVSLFSATPVCYWLAAAVITLPLFPGLIVPPPHVVPWPARAYNLALIAFVLLQTCWYTRSFRWAQQKVYRPIRRPAQSG
jgi:hypothetical protein